jgi:hypothetical protein
MVKFKEGDFRKTERTKAPAGGPPSPGPTWGLLFEAGYKIDLGARTRADSVGVGLAMAAMEV